MALSISTKEVAKGTMWSLAGNVFVKLVSFFYLIFLTAVASQDDIGVFYLALSLLTFANLFVEIISSSFSRFIPFFRARGEGKKIQKLLKVGFGATSLISLIVSIAIYFLAGTISDFYSTPDLKNVIEILSGYVFLCTIFNLSATVLRSMKLMRNQAIIFNVQNLSKLVLLIILSVMLGTNLFTITVSFLLSYLVSVIVSFFFMRGALTQLSKEPAGADISYTSLLAEVIPFGLMLTATSSLWTIIGSADKAMLGYFMTSSDVAIYTIATSLSVLILLFPSAISSIFFPIVSQLFGQKKMDEVRAICGTSMRWLLFVTIPFTIVFTVFSYDLLTLFYGNEYGIGGTAMALFTMGLLIRSLSDAPSLVLASMRLVKIELMVAAFVLTMNIILNFLLIPSFGIDGAALASLLSFTTCTILIFYYARKFFDFRLSIGMLKLILAGAISCIILYAAKSYLISIISFMPDLGDEWAMLYLGKVIKLAILAIFFFVCVLVFGITSLLLKSFKHEDLDVMKGAMRKAKILPEPVIAFTCQIISYGISDNDAHIY
ncbi:MAG: flippase [Candidatus Micrarchaeota archaeon]